MASDDGTLCATGEAELPASPDVAWLRLVLLTQGRTASEVASASGERINLVLDSIRETEPMLPELVTEAERTLEPLFDDEGGLTGYRLHRIMRAQMPPDAAGVLLDVAIMAGAGPGSGIRWGLRDPSFARARATEAALAVAIANAHAAAHALGRELLELLSAEVDCTVPAESTGAIVASARAHVRYTHRLR